jgi:hypothetical protein
LDGQEIVRRAPAVTEPDSSGGRKDAKPNPVAILPLFALVNRDSGKIRNLGQGEDVLQNLSFELDLCRILGVLVLAAAALAKVNAASLHATGRSRENDRFAVGVVNNLARQDEAEQLRPAGGKRAAISRLMDLDWNEWLLSLSYRSPEIP